MAVETLYGGNREYIKRAHDNFARLANSVGLPVGEITHIAHTKLPLMIAELAKEQGLHEPFHRAVFHAYWADGQNVGEWDVLLPIIEATGIIATKEIMVERFHDLEHTVDASFNDGRNLGVSAIPTFLIGREAVVGAQPYEVIKEVADRNLGLDLDL